MLFFGDGGFQLFFQVEGPALLAGQLLAVILGQGPLFVGGGSGGPRV